MDTSIYIFSHQTNAVKLFISYFCLEGCISKLVSFMTELYFQDGYVSGATSGQDATIQNGFKQGFKEGILSCFLTSQIKGILTYSILVGC